MSKANMRRTVEEDICPLPRGSLWSVSGGSTEGPEGPQRRVLLRGMLLHRMLL